MTILNEARKYRSIIETAMGLTNDQLASQAPDLSPVLKADNSLILAGTRINWNGVLKKAAVDLWDTAANNPDNAPALWEDIEYKDGYRIIPEIITTTSAFAKDELGWWKDILYKSLLEANVYTPDTYPAGWEIVSYN